MKICWIKAGGLAPLDTGGKIRSFQMLKALAGRHEISVLTFYREQPDDPHPQLRGLFHKFVALPMRLPPSQSPRDMLLYLSTIPSGLPHSMAKWYQPEVRRAVKDLVRSDAFDVIVCDFVIPAAMLEWGGKPPVVLFTHNVEAEIWERQAKVARGFAERWVTSREHRTMARAESKYVKLADHVVAVSRRNAEVFERYTPPDRITVISTGVDADYYVPTPELEQPDQVVFTASYDWMPNRDAAEWYLSDILPLLRAQIPGLVTWFVGRAPSASMQRAAEGDPSVRVTGRVDDVRPYMARCPVYIVPMRSGSGTRLKIFEAMAAGKAVVSTPAGAEGLPVEHERDILLAETPAEFARETARVLRDAELQKRLGTAARRLVEDRFSWKKVAQEFEAVLERVVREESGSALTRG